MALTDEEMETAMRYVAREMINEGVQLQDVGSVVKWMINHPLPSKATYEAVVTTQDEEEKQARIASLKEELAKLEPVKEVTK